GRKLHTLDVRALRRADLYVHWHAEECGLWIRAVWIRLLFLAHVERQDVRRRVVFLRDAKDGMAEFVNPFVEEPIELLARRLFNGSAKLFGLDRLMRVLRQVMIERAPPLLVAEHRAEHVQDRAAALIVIDIEESFGVGVIF